MEIARQRARERGGEKVLCKDRGQAERRKASIQASAEDQFLNEVRQVSLLVLSPIGEVSHFVAHKLFLYQEPISAHTHLRWGSHT